jgi:molybdenum cofactor biosynthesis enzyme MoaA
MECKFIKHGIALSYDQVLKPCCVWRTTPDWAKQNHYKNIEIQNWHQSAPVIEQYKILQNNQWPQYCSECQTIENQTRGDSMRGNSNQSYADYVDDDITLEIRPGNTCNFACQTCWPEASSRVAQYHSQAGLIDIKNINSQRLDDFDFLLPIAHRIKDVVLLGGEPFYDKACLKFLNWAQQHLQSHTMIFTNGSMIDMNFLQSHAGKLTIIFSLDAIGRPAEYVRPGTVWSDVLANYHAVKSLLNVQVRVNITCSVYNYWHLTDLLDLLCEDWPSVVTFGQPREDWYKESVIPTVLRPQLIEKLTQALIKISATNIESGQKHNALNAVKSIITNLNQIDFDVENHRIFCDFVQRMDRVKKLNAADYCDFLSKVLTDQ